MSRRSKQRPSPRSERSFRRRSPSRDAKIVIISCEGCKTEPGYFREIAKRWGIRTQVIVLPAPKGNNPINVLEAAIEEREKKKYEDFDENHDEVWCVFDREGIHHKPSTFDQTLDRARSKKINIECAVSVPCFEFWYLLHFKRTARGFNDKNEIARVLKEYLPEHNDPQKAVEHLEPRTEEAIENAQWVRKDNARGNRDRPSTDVDKLIVSLKKMRR